MPPRMTDRLTIVEHRLERLESGMDEISDALIAEIQHVMGQPKHLNPVQKQCKQLSTSPVYQQRRSSFLLSTATTLLCGLL